MSIDEKLNYNTKIIVEGGIKVLYKGLWVSKIDFNQEEISIGVIDPEHDIYPDINLRQYRLDGGDPYISRRHAVFSCKDNTYFIQDICNNNSTSIGTKTNVINNEMIQLNHGDRIFLSESIAFRFEQSEAQENDKENEQQEMIESEVETSGEEEPNEVTNTEHCLEVEKHTPLFFKHSNKFEYMIPLNPDDWEADETNSKYLNIGRRSTEDGIYPDIDLWKFYFNDGDEYIARKHARLIYENETYYFEDISGKGSTWINNKDEDHRLVKSTDKKFRVELKSGDRLIISDSVIFTFKKNTLNK